ncbi:MAG TPA: hypothetical protein VMH27_00760 [Puia sp.]|nr:hypothetical protein [Puia sp.]
MHILLLIVYGGLAGYGIWRVPFLRKSGIRPGWLLVLFAVHVVAGWVHNWIAYRYFPDHGDIWNYFSLSFLYRHRLMSEFHLFVSDNSTWTYITHNGIVYVQMVLDLFSADDMYVNTLLFSFPVFLGNVALFRVFRRRFGEDGLAAGTVFWLPSVLFWTACIYREGMLFMLLGFLFFHLDRWPARRSVYAAIGLFLLIAYFRLAVAVILVPALFVWWLVDRPFSARIRLRIGLIIIVLLTLVLFLPALRGTFLQAVTTEQASFQMLEGHSRLALPLLDGTPASFWRAFPFAVRNGLFEPLPGSGGQTAYLAFSIELVFVWLIVLLAAIRLFRASLSRGPLVHSNYGEFAVVKPEPIPADSPVRGDSPKSQVRGHSPDSPIHSDSPHSSLPADSAAFSLAGILFALAGMLLIGFVVPFAGTIVRYRSIYLPFLLAPAVHSLRSHPGIRRLNRWLNNKLRFLI